MFWNDVTPGRKVRHSASRENAVNQLLNRFNPAGAVRSERLQADYNRLAVHNASGGGIEAGRPVRIVSHNGTPDYAATFFGVAPAENGDEAFGVLLNRLEPGQYGNAAFAGVVSATVNIADAAHQYAVAGEAGRLVSAAGGGARILHKPSGTGEMMAVIRLGGGKIETQPQQYMGPFAIVGNADGSVTVMNSASPDDDVAGIVYIGNLTLYALPGLTGKTSELPRVTRYLFLHTLPGLTGIVRDLPRVTSELTMNGVSNLTGTVADLPRVTRYLNLYYLSWLTGAIADLPRVTTGLYLIGLPGLAGEASELPRVTTTLYLDGLSGLTGTVAELPRVTTALYLRVLPGLAGTVTDLPQAMADLFLQSLPGLTGEASELPENSRARQLYDMSQITGALSVVGTNLTVWYMQNAAVTPAEYDRTIKNIVDAGGRNGSLRISVNRTAASDADIQTLRERGWTVTEV